MEMSVGTGPGAVVGLGVLDASPSGGDLIAIIGPDGTLQQVSESGADSLAMSVGRLLGLDVMRLVHPEDRGHLVGMVIEAEQQGESDPFRIRFVRGDSTWATFDMWALALPLGPHSEDLAGGGAIVIGRSVPERSVGEGAAQVLRLAGRALGGRGVPPKGLPASPLAPGRAGSSGSASRGRRSTSARSGL